MWRKLAVLAGTTLIAGCVQVADPVAFPTPTATLTQESQSPTGAPPSTAPQTILPTAAPSSEPPAQTPQATPADRPTATFYWERVGNVGSAGAVAGFDDGYVVLTSGSDGLSATRLSTDGTDWSDPFTFGEVLVPCPTWSPRPSLYLHTLFSSDTSLLTFGMEDDTDCSIDSSAERPVGFVSRDGVTWEPMSDPISPAIGSTVWSVDGGWEAVVVENDEGPAPGESVVYRSADGSIWERAAELGNEIPPYDFSGPLTHGGASFDGTRLVIISQSDGGDEMQISLLSSHDGVSWERLDAPFTGLFEWTLEDDVPYGAALVAPSGARPFWTVAVETESGAATIWTTHDLVNWEQVLFPRPTVIRLESTSAGLIADGQVPCVFAGGSCPPPRQAQFLSDDGLTWTQLEPRLIGEFDIADGPAGPMLVGSSSGRVWLLRNSSAD